jgi:hypothetical protein
MALPGRWATMTAPTTMKAVKASHRARLTPGSRWKLPLTTCRATVTAEQTTNSASMDQATQVERLRKVRLAFSGDTSAHTLEATRGPSRDRYGLCHNASTAYANGLFRCQNTSETDH